MKVYFDHPTPQTSTHFKVELKPGWNNVDPDIKAELMLESGLVGTDIADARRRREENEAAAIERGKTRPGSTPAEPDMAPSIVPPSAPAMITPSTVSPEPVVSSPSVAPAAPGPSEDAGNKPDASARKR